MSMVNNLEQRASPRPVRRVAIAMSFLALVGATLLVWFEGQLTESIGAHVAYLGAGVLAIAGLVLVERTVRAHRAGEDERHVAVRDAAYRTAYRILAVGTVLALLLVSVAWESGTAGFTVEPNHIRALLLGVVGAAFWLPTAILAWSEREV